MISSTTPTIPSFAFQTPPRIVLHWEGAVDILPEEVSRLGSRPIIVCGNSLRASGALTRIVDSFAARGLPPVEAHIGVPTEPDLDALEACRQAILDSGADCVVAIGGGSVLDIGKAAAGLAYTGQTIADHYDGIAPIPESGGLPILAVPTTAGTGSEVTWVSVLTDTRGGRPRKASIRGGALMPRLALLDGSLTLSCPTHVTAASGMDAFVQALEAYTSNGANPLTDALAWEALNRVTLFVLNRAVQQPQDRHYRESLLLGSAMAGMALNTSRLGLVHGLAHPVGALSGAAHGAVCALLLAPVMRFNRESCAGRYARVAELNVNSADPELFIGIVEETVARLGLPTRLSQLGIWASDFDTIIADCMKSGSTKANPRPVDPAGALEVLRACL